MKLKVIYDADGTCTKVIKGYHISSQLWPGGLALIKVTNKKGKSTRDYQFSKVYTMEKNF